MIIYFKFRSELWKQKVQEYSCSNICRTCDSIRIVNKFYLLISLISLQFSPYQTVLNPDITVWSIKSPNRPTLLLFPARNWMRYLKWVLNQKSLTIEYYEIFLRNILTKFELKIGSWLVIKLMVFNIPFTNLVQTCDIRFSLYNGNLLTFSVDLYKTWECNASTCYICLLFEGVNCCTLILAHF